MNRKLEQAVKVSTVAVEVAAMKILKESDVLSCPLAFHRVVDDIYSFYTCLGLPVPDGIGTYVDDEYMQLLGEW